MRGTAAFHPDRIASTIEALKAENAKRRPCRFCDLLILDMAKHVRICHPPKTAGHRRGSTK